MTISMHTASAPAFAKMFSNMMAWLEAAQAHAEVRKFDSVNYLGLRLAPDMLPLAKQIQITSDTAKGCMARLAGVTPPSYEDNEASIDELIARINRTRDYVLSVSAAEVDGSEARVIEIPRRGGEPRIFDGENYLRHFALPNFYFHASMTYALLRHAGVPLGKMDYLGG